MADLLADLEADDTLRVPHEPLHAFAGTPFRPVGDIGQEVVDGIDVDPVRVVVELDPVSEFSPHWLEGLRAAQRAQPEVPVVLVGVRYHRERIAARPLAQADLTRFCERATQQRLDPDDSGRRQSKRPLAAAGTDRATGGGRIADESGSGRTAIRTARQVR